LYDVLHEKQGPGAGFGKGKRFADLKGEKYMDEILSSRYLPFFFHKASGPFSNSIQPQFQFQREFDCEVFVMFNSFHSIILKEGDSNYYNTIFCT